MNIEIEKKFGIINKNNLTDWLNNRTEFLSEKKQEDILFTHKELSDKRILRLRKEGGQEIVTFKNLIFNDDGDFLYCEEFETVYGKDNLDKFFEIISIVTHQEIEYIKDNFEITSNLENDLNKYGFKSKYIINKLRKNFKYDSIQLSMDSIKDLGDFLELEHLSPENHEDAWEDFNKVLEQIKVYLGSEIEKGYLDLLKEKIG
tara:strand:- start:6067 stop:6675 length:609 start_codon:yes stop_codon:yes gene_type:complete